MDFVQLCFSWPVLPASVLLCLVTAYWLLVILGAAEMDLFDLDLDVDVDPGLDGHESILDWGLASLKWLNIGDVPIMIWLSAFALPAWLMSVTFDKGMTDPTTMDIVKACARNFGVGIVAAKLLTQPLKGKLKFVEPNPSKDLIGRTVMITTVDATPSTGQAQCPTDNGAPLLLNVRTVEGSIDMGAEARIVEYSPDTRLYYVERVEG
ncbi:MAG: hypothetical protein KDA75_07335 [Planctomycetaceae bacterium]|nr:hypothetical protein [Planctomycetaceae bacterium]